MNNPTDTNQASELYELCKEVYEKTKWVLGNNADIYDYPYHQDRSGRWLSPIYTSDYLLEKLPDYPVGVGLADENYYSQIIVKRIATKYEAYYLNYVSQRHFGHSLADTPLKALLKLTIALSEAGELK